MKVKTQRTEGKNNIVSIPLWLYMEKNPKTITQINTLDMQTCKIMLTVFC